MTLYLCVQFTHFMCSLARRTLKIKASLARRTLKIKASLARQTLYFLGLARETIVLPSQTAF